MNDIDIRELELEIRGTALHTIVNGTPYTKEEVFDLAKKLLDYSQELFSCLDSRDLRKD